MMARQDQTVEQILTAMRKQQEILNSLQNALVTRARVQEYTEIQFNELVRIAKDGIELVQSLDNGDIVDTDWIVRRDELVTLAHRLIQDTD